MYTYTYVYTHIHTQNAQRGERGRRSPDGRKPVGLGSKETDWSKGVSIYVCMYVCEMGAKETDWSKGLSMYACIYIIMHVSILLCICILEQGGEHACINVSMYVYVRLRTQQGVWYKGNKLEPRGEYAYINVSMYVYVRLRTQQGAGYKNKFGATG